MQQDIEVIVNILHQRLYLIQNQLYFILFMQRMISQCSYMMQGHTPIDSPCDVIASCTITCAKSAVFTDHHQNTSNQFDKDNAHISMYLLILRLHLRRPGLKTTNCSKLIVFISSSPQNKIDVELLEYCTFELKLVNVKQNPVYVAQRF